MQKRNRTTVSGGIIGAKGSYEVLSIASGSSSSSQKGITAVNRDDEEKRRAGEEGQLPGGSQSGEGDPVPGRGSTSNERFPWFSSP